jgi:hypothetical protein
MSPASRDGEAEPGRPHRADWGRVADGVFLAGLGVFFLLATTRGLPAGFWVEAVSFWPVLLVSAGIRIIFEKTAMPWGVLLGPIVVLATLFWLAWGDRPEIRPPGEWRALSAERPEGAERVRVHAKLAGVRVHLEARPLSPSLLAEGRAASRDSETHLEVSHDDGDATLRLQGRRGGFLLIGRRREVWELGLTDRIPLDVDVDGVFIRADVDLRRGRTTAVEVRGAFNSTTLRLPPPTGKVTIRLEGAFSTFGVIVPEGTPVRHHGPGFPVNFVSKGPAPEGFSGEEPGYQVIVEGAFTMLNIEEGPPPPGGWPPSHAEEPEVSPLPAEAGRPPAEDPGGAAPSGT